MTRKAKFDDIKSLEAEIDRRLRYAGVQHGGIQWVAAVRAQAPDGPLYVPLGAILENATPANVARSLDRAIAVCKARTPFEAWLIRHGVSYGDASAATGLSRGILQKYAVGKVTPSAERQRIIADYTGGSVTTWPPQGGE